MSLFTVGLNYRTAPVGLRERLSFAPERLSVALQELRACDGVAEAAILSTCNRTDIYCGLDHGEGKSDGESAMIWLARYHGLVANELRPHLYTHHSEGAVRHMMRVASGLDSMILGEPQILGQVKDAYRAALETGTIGTLLGRLFQHSFSVAKEVRTDTSIGSSPVSVAFAAVALARQIFDDLGAQTALLVGAGDTVELAARHLNSSGLGRMIVANRTLANARRLASNFGGFAIELDEIPAHLAEADITVTSTASPAAIIQTNEVAAAIKQRKRRPMFMVDLAVPRDIDSAVAELEDVYLYTVDDLNGVIEQNLRTRRDAASQAEGIIDAHVNDFMGWLGTLDVANTIRQLRGDAQGISDDILAKARRKLAGGASPEEALRFLAHTLTNKLTHGPTARLRDAGSAGDTDLVDAARLLFGLAQQDDDQEHR